MEHDPGWPGLWGGKTMVLWGPCFFIYGFLELLENGEKTDIRGMLQRSWRWRWDHRLYSPLPADGCTWNPDTPAVGVDLHPSFLSTQVLENRVLWIGSGMQKWCHTAILHASRGKVWLLPVLLFLAWNRLESKNVLKCQNGIHKGGTARPGFWFLMGNGSPLPFMAHLPP